MDYVLGSVAALITGNVTPNRPRLIKRALTPTKHQPSPNVTPKSEFVEDRSIFLSPSMQKKKAIVKKSPKRIFQNPDLETTANEGDLSVNSPKAEKVKKHLKDDLDNEGAANKSALTPKSPKNKDKNRKESVSSQDDTQNLSVQDNNELTPKKKKRKRVSESELTASPKTESVVSEPPKTPGKSPKKMKQRRKSTAEPDSNKENDSTDIDNVPEIKTNTEVIKDSSEKPEIKSNINPSPKKKNKKRKKKAKGQNNQKTESNEILTKDIEVSAEDNKTKSSKKNNKKQKKNNQENKPEPVENVPKPPPTQDPEDPEDDSDEESTDTNFLNPNAITEKDSDSEHDSDDEIESENEEINKKVLEVGPAESSDDEEEEPAKKAAKPEKKNEEETQQEKGEGVTEEELKRTLFVGNVPFSNKCKKEIKKIFSKHGQIETVRIRTVPVKDGRYTPKLALIKNELHPERSTVNVYVKFTDPDSVEKALVENNTVLNDHHLRVSRSSSTGVEHDPKCSIFIGNMPFAMEDEALREKFEKCGEIESVRIIRDKKTNAGKGFGYVNFKSKDGVELALALTEEDLTIKNRILRVKRCTQVTNKQKATPSRNNQKSPAQGGFNRGKPGFNTGKPGFNRGKPGFNTGKPGFNRGKPDFNRGKPDFNRGKPDFNRGKPDFSRGKPDFNRGKPDFNRGRPGQDGDVQGFNKFTPRGQGNEQQGQNGAHRRILHKRKFQEGGDGPPNKVQKNINQPNKEKKPRKEFVGMTAEKKKKPNKFNKSQKKKKAISEILTK